MDKHEIGKLGEKLATSFLRRKGYWILEKNSRHSHNEIDIIAKNKKYIIFVEVKTRTTDNDLYSYFGSPSSAVTKAKQSRIIAAAKDYLSSSRHNEIQPRFDVIEVFLSKEDSKLLKINHIENAFGV